MSTCPVRRELLGRSAAVAGLLAGLGLLPAPAQAAWNEAAFAAIGIDAALAALGLAAPVESADIRLNAPDIAENGAAVSLGCATRLEGVHRLLLLVERNPAALCALFEVDPALEPDVVIRTRMAESSPVWAVALMHDGRVLYARKTVEVTLGGCGG
ncbi:MULTISPECIES: thiosulfate oxidation carrier protein SoxY [Sphaerotilus]|jgi:sulfur-oxidizing protein SoxY|uniref:Sulfur-oxidizing protein SoxY n=1 Tax=Sphaerotilus uruguayifluvii TaxID=2735897 RepID=A0ABX2G283_9BURK|nr:MULTISPECIES: thiosulfate oxidation carrier protein SoxY [Sphaerotilaceae]NRT56418.1 sulfur-oxidizing protein SoxY [Leptothrix sp. C29]GKQ57886.1 thiosulfate oxidation carrier protein SoxY [Sphaerotilus sp. FB-3]